MDQTRIRRILVPTWVRRLPGDLQLITGYLLIATAVITLPLVRETVLRPLLALPLVLFVPGYLLIAALFPESGTTPNVDADGDPDTIRERGIDGIERVALSFGTSIAIVPLLGLLLNFTPFGIRLVPIMITLLLFCVIMIVIAAQRRWDLPAAERFTIDIHGTFTAGWIELTAPDSRMDAILNVLLVLSVLLAVASVGYAIAVPKQGEAFTEFYLLTENDEGELVAANYPTELVRGQPTELVVGIGNHEHEPVNYTVVIVLQRTTIVNETASNQTAGTETAANTTTVRVGEQQVLQRLRTRLEHNETWRRQHSVEPPMTGERLRLAYLLYRGSPPATPTTDNAYREVHLWVTVTNSTTTPQIVTSSPQMTVSS